MPSRYLLASYADMWYEILNFITPGFMEELMSADCPVMEVINYMSEDHRVVCTVFGRELNMPDFMQRSTWGLFGKLLRRKAFNLLNIQ